MKKIRNIIILLLLAAGAFFGYQWWSKGDVSQSSFNFIPQDAVFVVETEDAIGSWKTFSTSNFWSHLKNYPPLAQINTMASSLDLMVANNKLLFTTFGKRNVLISAHVINADYDFLYVCNIGMPSVKLAPSFIVSLFKKNGYKYELTKEGETDMHNFLNPKDGSVLTMAFTKGVMLCSFKFGLVARALGAAQEIPLTAKAKFTPIYNNTPSGNVCKIYLNYAYAHAYLAIFSGESPTLKPIFNTMDFTGLGVSLSNNMLELNGFTNIKDSMPGYLQALAKSGNSAMEVHKVIPSNASFFMRFGFDNFQTFRNALLQTLEENPLDKKEFKRNLAIIETLLGLSLNDDILGWVGNEIAVAQFQQTRFIKNKLNNAIFVKTISTQVAEEKWDKIEKRISNRTPIKIQVGEYRGHKIRQFGLKGVFKIFFGKAFDKVDKPFFTNVGDYMVFADDAKMLLNIIDDFENKQTVASQPDFDQFLDGFSSNSNLFAYSNMPRFAPNLESILNPSSWAETQKSFLYTMYFKYMGFELEWKQTDNYFKTRLCTFNEIPSEQTQTIIKDIPKEFNPATNPDSFSEADQFLSTYIYGEVEREFYDNGQLKFEAYKKDNVYNGKFSEYYENGNLKIEGKYRKGAKTGKWTTYLENGEVDKTENFGNLIDNLLDKIGI